MLLKDYVNGLKIKDDEIIYVGYVTEKEKEKTKRWRDRYSKKASEVARWQKLYECAMLQINKED